NHRRGLHRASSVRLRARSILSCCAVQLLDNARRDPATTIVRQTPELFDRALDLYRRRPDKGYSLIDCMSMVVCGDLGITDVLTRDAHFEQEGFRRLLLASRRHQATVRPI